MEDKQAKKELSREEKLSLKYIFIKHKIIEHFDRGCRYVNVAKIVCAILFLIYSFLYVAVGKESDSPITWLLFWIFFIFLLVFVFMIIDYTKYLISEKLIPYLKDDDQLEFGEYDVLVENEDEDDNEEEEDED